MDFLSPTPPDASGGTAPPSILDQFMASPRIQAALLQGGLGLMQPMAWGDNGTSFLGRAIGSGAEASQRQEAEDIKAQEAASKEDLRGSQANAAEARAGAAGANANTAAMRLQLLQSESDRKKESGLNAIRAKATHDYETMKAKIQLNNTYAAPKDRIVIPEFNDWASKNGYAAMLSLFGGGTTGSDVVEGGAGLPPASPDMTGKPSGWYSSSKFPGGKVYWNGTDWKG